MKRIRAGIAQVSQPHKVGEYNRRRKAGLCVSCGAPATDIDDRVSLVLCRGQYVVERGRKAARCTACMAKEKTNRLKRCRMPIIAPA